jgi:hypothetical protein
MPGERLLGKWPRKCKVCGKDFFANDDWVYKTTYDKGRKLIWFCSYHCKQDYIRKKEEKKNVL